MEFKTMYSPQKDSPTTFLLGDISSVDTLVTVASAAALPQVLPYPLTIGIDKTLTETVMVTVQNLGNNQLTVTRGTPAYAWPAGSKVARVLTAKDISDIQSNITNLNTDLETAQSTLSENVTDISALKTTVGDSTSGLVKGLTDEVARATGAEGTEVTRATAAEASLGTNKINRSELAQVITDWNNSADGTKVLITITRYNSSTKQTSQYTRTLPVVTDEAMGVMTPEAYAEITALRNDVNSLINAGGRFIGTSFATKAALNTYTVPTSVKPGDFTYVIDDETHSGATTRYVRSATMGTTDGGATWHVTGYTWDFTFVVEYDPIGIANTTTLGTVKSSSSNGKVFVETDGTMSVVGWDIAMDAIAEAQGDISDLSQGKLDKSTTPSVVYANNASGVPTPVASTDAPTSSTVPVRTTGGQVRVGSPVLADAATPKTYVDAFNTAPIAGGTATAITIPTANFLQIQGGKLVFIAAANNSGAATTINSLPLYKPGTTTSPKLVAGKMYTVWYDSANGGRFFLQASAEGTAVAGNVLAGKTFSNDDDTGVVGTLIPPKPATGNAISQDVLNKKIFSNSANTGIQGSLNVGEGSYPPEYFNPWTIRSSAADNQWYSVCYGNGLFVAVSNTGTGNRVMTSPDGITWTLRTSAADNSWRSVCYGKGIFVAVSDTGTGNRVMTSPDGITWTIRSSAADNCWSPVCYGNGLFVAVAYTGTGNRVMTSPDGITWTIRTSAADNIWKSVCYGNGLFVAVAYTGTGNRVMTSPDGITWTIRTSAADNGWKSVCYGNGLFVAVAYSGTGNSVMTSPDGITWTTRTSTSDNQWNSVCYGNGLFVAVATTGAGNRVMTSPDGSNWATRSSAADNEWYSVCYGNGIFVAVSDTGTGNRVMTMNYSLEEVADKKPTGVSLGSFILRTYPVDNGWRSVCYGNGLFVAVAYSGTGNRVMTSPDSINWTIRTSAADNDWRSVCYGNGLFVAVATTGAGNRVMTSPDGINWTTRTSVADNTWYSVCYGNGLFVAVATTGTGNRVMTSPDGINWTIRTYPVDNSWRSVCYGNGLFVAVAYSGTGNRVMTSPDGINWTIRTSAADNDWYSVCYGNGLFVAVAATGIVNRVMTSPDGINWTTRTSAADNDWLSVCYGNGLFVAVATGTGNHVMTSPDGITWTIRTSAADNDWYSVCYGNGLFVAVAYTGTGNRVMTANAVRQELPGISKCVRNLGILTPNNISTTQLGFYLKYSAPDIFGIIGIENIMVQFQKFPTSNYGNTTLTWSYDKSTGILQCQADLSMFDLSHTPSAKICIIM